MATSIQKTITEDQKKSQMEKLASANAFVFLAIVDLNNKDLDNILLNNIADDLDTAIHTLEEVFKFLKSIQFKRVDTDNLF